MITGLLDNEEIDYSTYQENDQKMPIPDSACLKIFCMPGDKKNIDGYWPKIAAINKQISGPAIIVSKFEDIASYQAGIKEGIYYFLNTPSGKKHILNQIKLLASNTGDAVIEASISDSHLISGESADSTSPLIFSLKNNIHYRSLTKSPPGAGIKKKHAMPYEADNNDVSLEMKNELQRGLDQKEFRLYYQPVIDINKNNLAGFESLIRWKHPVKGIIPPDEFIPAAEKTNLIIPMGYWIIEEAIRQIYHWKNEFIIDQPFKVGINLSAKQFLHEGLSEKIVKEVSKKNLFPENVAFEITESAFMEDMEMANMTLLTLKSKKFPLYLDDFGTGYSSLTYLLHFPVDTIKIDKSFVEWMHIDDQSREIVRSVTSLAHNLNMKVVAEGIESEEHLSMINEFGCDLAQGYFFSKPLPSDEATLFVQKYYKSSYS